MLSRKVLASLVLVAIVLSALVTPSMAAPPDFSVWEGPIAQGVAELDYEVQNGGAQSQIFVGPGRRGIGDVALTVEGNRIFAGPVTRLPNVLYTVDGQRMWAGKNTWGLQNVLFSLSDDDRIYAGPSTHDLSRALYTIRDNHVYEGPTPLQERIVFTSNTDLESTDVMTKFLLAILIEGRF